MNAQRRKEVRRLSKKFKDIIARYENGESWMSIVFELIDFYDEVGDVLEDEISVYDNILDGTPNKITSELAISDLEDVIDNLSELANTEKKFEKDEFDELVQNILEGLHYATL